MSQTRAEPFALVNAARLAPNLNTGHRRGMLLGNDNSQAIREFERRCVNLGDLH
jgi:hypothetical protein